MRLTEKECKRIYEGSATKYSIELDVSVDWDDKEERAEFKEVLSEYRLTCRAIVENGPGGGWPCVYIIGTEPNLRSWLSDNYCDGDLEDVEFHMESAEVYVPVKKKALSVN